VPELVPKQIDLLILRGVLTIDIDRRLNGDTLVSWASPLATPGTILAHCEH
jgi:hypothetical protein